MTYREKLAQEHPECVGNQHRGGCKDCPTDYGYEEGIHCHTVGDDCTACWDGEIPETIKAEERLDVTEEVKLYHYNKGLEDAWELAKKVALDKTDYTDGYTSTELKTIFNKISLQGVFREYSVQEALAKLEAYEKEQAEIKVGDVVCIEDSPFEEDNDVYGVVTGIYNDNHYEILVNNGDGISRSKGVLRKTGKHIDIQSVLEQIAE